MIYQEKFYKFLSDNDFVFLIFFSILIHYKSDFK